MPSKIVLTFGGPEERELQVNHEILGTTDENEPLQAMMKDAFTNYVVKKVLEPCDDQQHYLLVLKPGEELVCSLMWLKAARVYSMTRVLNGCTIHRTKYHSP
ncbi:hypothetical protein DY000_02034714 [Brassica cretica]|uniref:Uncharacterized protein n=1 Tax=Brassica cretica TaxID=69181 RepID=A0ABQ7DY15_BRACR|nr:hypothetical protein DY000_02034714 [Brassica cretica]